MWPRDGVIFSSKSIIWTNWVEVHLVMLYTKYQGSKPASFKQEYF